MSDLRPGRAPNFPFSAWWSTVARSAVAAAGILPEAQPWASSRRSSSHFSSWARSRSATAVRSANARDRFAIRPLPATKGTPRRVSAWWTNRVTANRTPKRTMSRLRKLPDRRASGPVFRSLAFASPSKSVMDIPSAARCPAQRGHTQQEKLRGDPSSCGYIPYVYRKLEHRQVGRSPLVICDRTSLQRLPCSPDVMSGHSRAVSFPV